MCGFLSVREREELLFVQSLIFCSNFKSGRCEASLPLPPHKQSGTGHRLHPPTMPNEVVLSLKMAPPLCEVGDEVFSKRELKEIILAKRADAMYAKALPLKFKAINAEFKSLCFRTLEESMWRGAITVPPLVVLTHFMSIYPSGLYLLHSPPASSDDPYWSYVSGDTGETWIAPFVSPVGEGDAWQMKLLRAERLFCSRVIPMNARYFPLLINM